MPPAPSVSARAGAPLLAVSAARPARRAAATPGRDQEARLLIVATEDDFRPFEFVKDGKPTGFDNEMVEDLRKYAPFEIRQEILPWTGMLAGVSTGKYDVAITAAIITKERTQVARFHQPDRRRDALLRQAQGRHEHHLDQGSERQDGRRPGGQRAARAACPSSGRCWRRTAARSARSSSTPPIPRPIRTWRSAAPTTSSTPSST